MAFFLFVMAGAVQQVQQRLRDVGQAVQGLADDVGPITGRLAAAVGAEQAVAQLSVQLGQMAQQLDQVAQQQGHVVQQLGQVVQQQAQMTQQLGQVVQQQAQMAQQQAQMAQQLGQVQQQQAQDASVSRVLRRNDVKRASNARSGAVATSELALLEKEALGGNQPLGALPGPGVGFPATLREANSMNNVALNALAEFYHEDFGVAGDGLPARRCRFLAFVGIHNAV